MKKPKRTTLRNRADKMFSMYVRLRDGRCRRCGNVAPPAGLQCHHAAVPRKYLKTRYEPENGMAMCGGCHFTLEHWPLQAEAFVIGELGEERYRELRLQALDVDGPKVDYEAVIAWLKEELATQEASA